MKLLTTALLLFTAIHSSYASDGSQVSSPISNAITQIQKHCKAEMKDCPQDYYTRCLKMLDSSNRIIFSTRNGIVVLVGHTVFQITEQKPNHVSREVLITAQEDDLPINATPCEKGFIIETQSGKFYEIHEHGVWSVISPPTSE